MFLQGQSPFLKLTPQGATLNMWRSKWFQFEKIRTIDCKSTSTGNYMVHHLEDTDFISIYY